MTAQSPLTESPIPPPVVVSSEFGNNPQQTEAKKNIAWARVVRGDVEGDKEETMPLTPPPVELTKEEEAIILPVDVQVDHIEDAKKEEQAVLVSVTVDRVVADADTGNAGSPKKPAWSKPIGGVVVGGVSTPVIGGITSWPDLSESTRSVAKSTSDSAPKPVSAARKPVANPKAPVVSRVAPKQANSGRISITGPNNTVVDRHRWNKRNGNQAAVRNVPNSFGRPTPPPPPPPPSLFPPPPPFPCFELPYGPPVFPMLDNSCFPADLSSMTMNFMPHPPGDLSRMDFNEFRHVQDRNWNAFRNSIPLDLNFGRSFVPGRGFMRSPPPPPPPPPMRSYVNPIRFGVAVNPFMYYPALPFYGHAPPPPLQEVLFPFVDPSLSLVRQVDYYFSDANLVKDDFLKSNMDAYGWVPLKLIAGFRRVQQITTDFDVILSSMRASSVVEVQDGKIRRRNGWKKWTSHSSQVTSNSSRVQGKGDSSSTSSN